MDEAVDARLAATLLDCEDRLLHGDPSAAATLLAPYFEEVGVDGRRSGRDEVLRWLARRDPALRWRFLDAEARALSEDLALLRYLARREGAAEGGSRRVSLWRRSAQGWQLLFHQATRVPPAGSPASPPSEPAAPGSDGPGPSPGH